MGSYKNSCCRICSSEKLTKVLPLKPSPLADNYITNEQLDIKQELFSLDLYLCNNCGLVQLLTVIEPEDIYINYLYKTSTSLGLDKHFKDSALDIIKRYNIKKDSFIIDIGSNIGSLLNAYKNFGMEVLGIDPAIEIAKEATQKGVETLPIFFNQDNADTIVKKYKKADVINSNNMMANIDKIDDLVKGIKILLDKDGIFIMETSYLLHLIDNMVFDTIYHEHLSYFGLKALQYLFEKNSLKIVSAQIVDTKGGSLKCFIEHEKNQSIDQSVQKIMDIETQRELYDEKIYINYLKRIDTQKTLILNYLDKLKNNNTKIYGYGASNTTTTLLHHFEISKYIEIIVDDNEIKIKRFSPNYHIPILSSDNIYKSKVDYVVIFAWRFADHIISKHQKFLDNGGKFIIPLPQFKVIG